MLQDFGMAIMFTAADLVKNGDRSTPIYSNQPIPCGMIRFR